MTDGLEYEGRNLDQLIGSMDPVLYEQVLVFAHVEMDVDTSQWSPLMRFEEREGVTLILPLEVARQHVLQHAFPCRMITLNVHSALDAVGFLARVTNCLARLGMGVNPVSAYFHDHLFVPENRAEEALAALQRLSREA